MTIAAIVTRGYGSFGTIADVVMRGYISGEDIAMAVASQTLEEGNRNLVMHFTNTGDAEAAVLKVDVSALTPPCAQVAIHKVKYATNGTGGAAPTGVNILWDATTDDVALTIPANASDCLDYKDIGGLQNPMSAGATGDVLFTCSADDAYSITLWMVKKY
jgi:hypothetical protein